MTVVLTIAPRLKTIRSLFAFQSDKCLGEVHRNMRVLRSFYHQQYRSLKLQFLLRTNSNEAASPLVEYYKPNKERWKW
jgi:hypothetical protein